MESQTCLLCFEVGLPSVPSLLWHHLNSGPKASINDRCRDWGRSAASSHLLPCTAALAKSSCPAELPLGCRTVRKHDASIQAPHLCLSALGSAFAVSVAVLAADAAAVAA